MAKRPSYPPDFRRRIQELVRSGRSVNSVAAEFQVARQSIMKWLKQDDLDAGLRSDGLTSDERRELTQLCKRVKDFEEEKVILRRPRPSLHGKRDRFRIALRIQKGNQAVHAIATMRRVLAVSPSGYYAWCKRGPSKRWRDDVELGDQLEACYRGSEPIF